MPTRLPPLNALRAFEAAARHLSFRRAAEELNVTPAAVSHQIKALEEHLDVVLFHRMNRGLRLSDAAREALPELAEGFEMLSRAAARLRGTAAPEALAVSVSPSLASKWLIPRLDGFTATHPGIDARINAEYELPDLRRREADLAVHFGSGHYPGMRVDRLASVSVTPLCSPSLASDTRPLAVPADLRHHRLIHDDTLRRDETAPDWEAWLERAGVEGVDTSRGAHFSHTMLALDAAVDQQGVVLTIDLLARRDLAAGRLVAPFELEIPLQYAYWVVCLEDRADDPKIAAFRDWVFAQVRG